MSLAVVLLQESRVHGCHMQKTLFPGPVPLARRDQPRVHACMCVRPVPTANRVRSYIVGGRR